MVECSIDSSLHCYMWDWREVTQVILYFLSQQSIYNAISSIATILSPKDQNVEVGSFIVIPNHLTCATFVLSPQCCVFSFQGRNIFPKKYQKGSIEWDMRWPH